MWNDLNQLTLTTHIKMNELLIETLYNDTLGHPWLTKLITEKLIQKFSSTQTVNFEDYSIVVKQIQGITATAVRRFFV